MKKFLSLVLALIMTMSLVTISAGAADFADDSSITYEEAVDVMTAIGVVSGYEDGSFKPGTALNRGQAAKIICNMILGPTTASALATTTAPFSDVPADHVFAGYITYCVSEGIISGYADGTFKPANPLTGYAFMKMLLGALGYDADIEGYNEPSWSVQVAKRALNIGLDDDLKGDFVGTKALTREEACLYAFNALKSTMVDYENASKITVGDIVITNNSKAKEVEADEDYDYTKGFGTDDKTMEFCEKYFPKLKCEIENDDFGRPSTKWAYKGDSVGKYTSEAELVYTAAVKGIALADDLDDADLAFYSKDEDGNKVVDIDVYYNGVKGAGFYDYEDMQELLDLNKDFPKTGKSIVVELYANSDDVINRAVTITTYLAEVTDVVEDKVNTRSVDERALELTYVDATGENTIVVMADEDTANFDEVYDEVEKGDMVLVTPKGDTTASTYALYVGIPETVEGIISYASTKALKVDGTTYNFATVAMAALASIEPSEDEAVVYLDNYGYVVGTTAKNGTDDKTLAISEIYTGLKDGKIVAMAEVVYSNGTPDNIVLADYVEDDFVVEYDKEKGEYTLTSIATYGDEEISSGDYAGYAFAMSAEEMTTKTKKIEMGDENVYFADDVKFIYVDVNEEEYMAAKVSVKEGAQKIEEGTDIVVVINDDEKISTVYVYGKATNIASTEGLIFVAKQTGTVRIKVGEDEYESFTTFDAYLNGEKIDDFYASEDEDVTVGSFYEVETDNDTGAYILEGNEYDDEGEDLQAIDVDSYVYDDIENSKFLVTDEAVIDLGAATIVDNDTDIETLAGLKQALKELDDGCVVKLAALYDEESGDAEYIYITAVNAAIPQ